MPRRITMSNLISLCKEHADLENDDHISDAAWKKRISLVYGSLYEIVAPTGYRYFEYSTDIEADGSASYDEPDDHLSTVVIQRVLDASGRLSDPLVELNPGEESNLAGTTGTAIGYQLVDDLVYLYPKPTSGTYRWRYIAQPPDLGTYADGDVIDVVTPSGMLFVVWGTVASAKSKSESDLRHALAMQSAAQVDVQTWAAQRTIEGRRRQQGVEIDDLIPLPDGRWR